jgi:hypothetical protein
MNQRTSELSEIEKVMVVKTGLGIYARSIQTMYTMPPPNGIFYFLFINAYSLSLRRKYTSPSPGHPHPPN